MLAFSYKYTDTDLVSVFEHCELFRIHLFMVPKGSVLCIGTHAIHLFTTPARALAAQMPTSIAFPIALKIDRHLNIIFNYPKTDGAGFRAHCASHAMLRRENIPSKSAKSSYFVHWSHENTIKIGF